MIITLSRYNIASAQLRSLGFGPSYLVTIHDHGINYGSSQPSWTTRDAQYLSATATVR